MSNQWELCVIGTALNDPQSMMAATDLIPSDFTGENQAVWAEILTLHNNKALDVGPLTASVIDRKIFNDPDDAANFIRQALGFRGANMDEYVKKVIDMSIRRSLKKTAGIIAARAYEEDVSSQEVLEYAEMQILKLRRDRTDGYSMADLMGIFVPRLDKIRDGTFEPAWKPKLSGVRNILRYVEEDELIIIAGRPGEGKSTYMRFEGYHHVVGEEGRLLVINMENSPIEYARNLVALRAGIDSDKLKTGQITENEARIISRATEDLARLPIFIEYASDIPTIASLYRKHKSQNDITMAVVDYIQLIYNNAEKRVDDIAKTTNKLKRLSMELKFPTMAASQLSRDIEKRGENSTPKLSDLRESGSLEQDANIVIFPRKVWTELHENEVRSFQENIDPRTRRTLHQLKAQPVKMHILKNRNGSTGVTPPVKWNMATGNYNMITNENI